MKGATSFIPVANSGLIFTVLFIHLFVLKMMGESVENKPKTS